jgi:hypothetical protein
MKKLFISFAILFLITGCTSLQITGNKVEAPSNYIYENEDYSLQLPAEFQEEPGAKDGYLNPKQVDGFPSIRLGLASSKANPKIADLLGAEKTFLTGLCEQTDGCAKIIKWEKVTLDGRDALKFTTQQKGRSLDDQRGYINSYHYSVPQVRYEYDGLKYPQDQNKYPLTYILKFSISANDQENPELKSKVFDTITSTIHFK